MWCSLIPCRIIAVNPLQNPDGVNLTCCLLTSFPPVIHNILKLFQPQFLEERKYLHRLKLDKLQDHFQTKKILPLQEGGVAPLDKYNLIL